jgi:hypothetical protein
MSFLVIGGPAFAGIPKSRLSKPAFVCPSAPKGCRESLDWGACYPVLGIERLKAVSGGEKAEQQQAQRDGKHDADSEEGPEHRVPRAVEEDSRDECHVNRRRRRHTFPWLRTRDDGVPTEEQLQRAVRERGDRLGAEVGADEDELRRECLGDCHLAERASSQAARFLCGYSIQGS